MYSVSADWINGVAFAPDGATLAIGDRTGGVSLLRAAGSGVLRQMSSGTDYVGDVQFTPDGATLLVETSATTVQLRDTATGARLHTLPGDFAALAPARSVLAMIISNTVQLWRPNDGARLHTFADAHGSVTFTHDGTRLIVDGMRVQTWRLDDGTLLDEQLGPLAWWYSTPSSDGTLRLTAGIGLWRVADGSVVGGFDDAFAARAFAPNGQIIAVTQRGGVIQLRRVSDGTLLHTLHAPNYNGYLNAVVFAPDSATVAVGTRRGDVLIWRVGDGALLHTFSISEKAGGLFRDSDTLAYTSDGRLLAAGSSNRRIYVDVQFTTAGCSTSCLEMHERRTDTEQRLS